MPGHAHLTKNSSYHASCTSSPGNEGRPARPLQETCKTLGSSCGGVPEDTSLDTEDFIRSLNPFSRYSSKRTLWVLLREADFGGRQSFGDGPRPQARALMARYHPPTICGLGPSQASPMSALGGSCWPRPPKRIRTLFTPAQDRTKETPCGCQSSHRF